MSVLCAFPFCQDCAGSVCIVINNTPPFLHGWSKNGILDVNTINWQIEAEWASFNDSCSSMSLSGWVSAYWCWHNFLSCQCHPCRPWCHPKLNIRKLISMLIYIANLRCMGKLAANSDPECPLGGTYPKKSYIQICSKNIHTVLGDTAILGFSQCTKDMYHIVALCMICR